MTRALERWQRVAPEARAILLKSLDEASDRERMFGYEERADAFKAAAALLRAAGRMKGTGK